MFFHTTAFGDKYSGLTCLALMWFVTTPPERSAIMKVVYRVAEIGASGMVTKEISQKIVLLPVAPKFGTQEVNRFSQSPT